MRSQRKLWILIVLMVCSLSVPPLGAEPGPVVLVYTASTFAHVEPIRLEIHRSARKVLLFRGADCLKSYPVAVGRPGWETPLGTFQVLEMVRDPDWQHPLTGKIYESGEAANELGHYWIGFSDANGAIGFHGTPHPETVGKPVSHGCVRMFERDIAELYAQVRTGTVVTVTP